MRLWWLLPERHLLTRASNRKLLRQSPGIIARDAKIDAGRRDVGVAEQFFDCREVLRLANAWTTSAVGSLPNRSLAHLEPVSDAPKRKLENGEQRQSFASS